MRLPQLLLFSSCFALFTSCGPNVSGDVDYKQGTPEQCTFSLYSDSVAVHGEVSGDEDYLVCSDGILTYEGSAGDIVVETGGVATIAGSGVNVYVHSGATIDISGSVGDVFFEDGATINYHDNEAGDIWLCDELIINKGQAEGC